MASRYSIAEADIQPIYINATDYTNLLGTGNIDDIIEESENLFDAFLGGAFTTAANISLAKPFIILLIVYNLHLRRSNNADYDIPEQVIKNFEAVVKWTSKIGNTLLLKEDAGVEDVNSVGIEYVVPTQYYSMTSLERL